MKATFDRKDVGYCPFCNAECKDTNGIDLTTFACGTVATPPNRESDGWERANECIEREKFVKAGQPIHRASAGVWERPGEIGPNGCYPDPSDFD